MPPCPFAFCANELVADAERYLSADGYHVDAGEPKFTARNDALYINLKDGAVVAPKEMITREDAEGIIHTVNVAIHCIIETEEISGRIGTKGFMK